MHTYLCKYNEIWLQSVFEFNLSWPPKKSKNALNKQVIATSRPWGSLPASKQSEPPPLNHSHQQRQPPRASVQGFHKWRIPKNGWMDISITGWFLPKWLRKTSNLLVPPGTGYLEQSEFFGPSGMTPSPPLAPMISGRMAWLVAKWCRKCCPAEDRAVIRERTESLEDDVFLIFFGPFKGTRITVNHKQHAGKAEGKIAHLHSKNSPYWYWLCERWELEQKDTKRHQYVSSALVKHILFAHCSAAVKTKRFAASHAVATLGTWTTYQKHMKHCWWRDSTMQVIIHTFEDKYQKTHTWGKNINMEEHKSI